MTEREDSGTQREIVGDRLSNPYIVGGKERVSMTAAAFVIDDLEAFGRMMVRFAALHEMDAEMPIMEIADRILTAYGVTFTSGFLDRRGRLITLSQLGSEPVGLWSRELVSP
jgi:hypothetical protein